MKVAIEGCAHGELDKIYDSVQKVQEKHGIVIDLLIICGDFQAVRNDEELEELTCAPQYRRKMDFHKYYSGAKHAPVTTIFIGGNHEVPGFMRDLYYGGWVAPNIYYLGCAGVVRVGPLRIAGISGQFRPSDYFTGHHECPPYNDTSRRSANNVREWDVIRLGALVESVDIVVSHDWPRGIWKHGNCAEMLDHRDLKGDLRREMDGNTLGSPAAMDLLKKLRPGFWFSAHLHVKFAALVPHEDGTFTRFLSLDRCGAKKDFLQILDVDPRSPSYLHRLPAATSGGRWANRWRSKQAALNRGKESFARLDYDPEWLAIQKVNHANLSFSTRSQKATITSPSKDDIEWIVQRLREKIDSVPRQQTSLRRHSSLLPTKLREASGDKSLRDLSTAQLRELFETRGLEFPGHMDRCSMLRQLQEHDDFFAAERTAEQTAADDAFPIPANFKFDKGNAAAQKRQLLEILDLPDVWEEQVQERLERMRVHIDYDPLKQVLASPVGEDSPAAIMEKFNGGAEGTETVEVQVSPSPSSPMEVDVVESSANVEADSTTDRPDCELSEKVSDTQDVLEAMQESCLEADVAQLENEKEQVKKNDMDIARKEDETASQCDGKGTGDAKPMEVGDMATEELQNGTIGQSRETEHVSEAVRTQCEEQVPERHLDELVGGVGGKEIEAPSKPPASHVENSKPTEAEIMAATEMQNDAAEQECDAQKVNEVSVETQCEEDVVTRKSQLCIGVVEEREIETPSKNADKVDAEGIAAYEDTRPMELEGVAAAEVGNDVLGETSKARMENEKEQDAQHDRKLVNAQTDNPEHGSESKELMVPQSNAENAVVAETTPEAAFRCDIDETDTAVVTTKVAPPQLESEICNVQSDETMAAQEGLEDDDEEMFDTSLFEALQTALDGDSEGNAAEVLEESPLAGESLAEAEDALQALVALSAELERGDNAQQVAVEVTEEVPIAEETQAEAEDALRALVALSAKDSLGDEAQQEAVKAAEEAPLAEETQAEAEDALEALAALSAEASLVIEQTEGSEEASDVEREIAELEGVVAELEATDAILKCTELDNLEASDEEVLAESRDDESTEPPTKMQRLA